MSYCGLDPSFTGCGISFIHDDLMQIEFYERSVELDKKSTLVKFEAIRQMARQIKHVINSCTDENSVYIGQEVSTAYTGWFVAELFGLAYAINQTINRDIHPRGYDLFSQEYIKFIHGHKRTKEDTIFLVEDVLLPIFRKYGYKVTTIEKTEMTSTGVKEEAKNRYIKRETISNNEADSFIYTVRQFIKYNPESDITKDILKEYPRFATDGKELK